MSIFSNGKIINLPKEESTKDSFGTEILQKSLIQFVQGTVAYIQVGDENPRLSGNNSDLGVIWALPSVGNQGINKETFAKKDSKFRYVPLLRGFQETPNIGDPVLLCEFGGQKYYLGPLNSDNHCNINRDKLRPNQTTSGGETGNLSDSFNKSGMIEQNYRHKLGKRLNPKLDNPLLNLNVNSTTNEIESGNKDSETGEPKPDFILPKNITQHGDTILEGRHGNSIRIGSRNIHPYLFISNARGEENNVESTLDGSLMVFSNKGSIRDHFLWDQKSTQEPGPVEEVSVERTPYSFTFADDEIENVHRSISKTFTTSLGRGLGPHKDNGGNEQSIDDPNIEKTLYDYRENQVLITSGRLMFNSRTESTFISSKQFIHIGAGNNVNISTSNTHLVEAATSMVVNTPLFKVNAPGKVYIDGQKNTDQDDNIVGSIFLGNPALNQHLERAVMGEGLVTFLTRLISEIQILAYDVAAAIGARENVNAPIEIMRDRVNSLEGIMGITGVDTGFDTEPYPKGMADQILSDSVRIKK